MNIKERKIIYVFSYLSEEIYSYLYPQRFALLHELKFSLNSLMLLREKKKVYNQAGSYFNIIYQEESVSQTS